MIDQLPEHILVEIIKHMDHESALAFSMTSHHHMVLVNERFPDLQEHFGCKYQLGCCLKDMMHFIMEGGHGLSMWGWSLPHSKRRKIANMVMMRYGKHDFIKINSEFPWPRMDDDDILAWFDHHLVPEWKRIEFHTGCWYKSAEKKKEYMDLTQRMTALLKSSL